MQVSYQGDLQDTTKDGSQPGSGGKSTSGRNRDRNLKYAKNTVPRQQPAAQADNSQPDGTPIKENSVQYK